MDTSRYVRVAGQLMEAEARHHFQDQLKQLSKVLSGVFSAREYESIQRDISDKLQTLRDGLGDVTAHLSSIEYDNFIEMGADKWFSNALYNHINELIVANPITTLEAANEITRLCVSRSEYLTNQTAAVRSLINLGLVNDAVPAGNGEVSFQIPRELFHNSLDGLVVELRSLRHLIQVLAEAETGKAVEIEFGKISSSDPIFTFIVTVAVLKALANAVSWALKSWKEVEEIRKIRAETEKLKAFGDDNEITRLFDDRIKSHISKSIDDKVTELLGDNENLTGRSAEQQSGLAWSLNSLIAHIERGLRIEFRIGVTDGTAEDEATALEISQLIGTLEYKKPAGSPITQIPLLETDSSLDDKAGKT